MAAFRMHVDVEHLPDEGVSINNHRSQICTVS
jgi:hypothetical protein